MFRKLATPVAVTVLIAAAPVYADQEAGQARDSGSDHFEQTFSGDSASGNTERDLSNRNEAFDELDRNQDGKLDEDELNTWGNTAAGTPGTSGDVPDERSQQMLNQFDRDGDNAISREELDAGPSDAGEARGSNL